MSLAGKNIVGRLPAFSDRPAIRDFVMAWDRWRGEDVVPARSQIKLADMPHLMRGMMLIDAIAPDELVFRFSGSLYQDIYDYDFTGMNYLEITEPESREFRSARLWSIVSQPAIAVWSTPQILGTDFIGVSVPIAPDAPDQVFKIMQVLVPLSGVGHLARERIRRGQTHVEFSDRFQYLDIGAGKPDSALEK